MEVAVSMNLLEQVQRRAMMMIRGLKHLSYEGTLKFFSSEKRRVQGDLITAFQFLKKAYKEGLFIRACRTRTNGVDLH